MLLKSFSNFRLVVDGENLRWWASIVFHGKIDSDLVDVETKSLGQTVHAVILGVLLHGLIISSHISVILVDQVIDSISEPSLGVSSEFIGILGLQDLSGKSHWRLNVFVAVSDFLLEFVVFLLGVPVPFVNLLEFETGFFGKLLELGFCRFAKGILITFLELIDLVTALSSSFETYKSRSILLFVNNNLLFR